MVRPTRLGSPIPILESGALGYDPEVDIGDLPDPIDRAIAAAWYIPVAPADDAAFVQSTFARDVSNVATATLDNTPTPGNILVAFVAIREGAGTVITMSGSGWTLVRREYTGGAADAWPAAMYWRLVQIGDGANWSSSAGQHILALAEITGVSALDTDVGSSNATSAGTISITPVTADPVLLVSGVTVRVDSDKAFTPASGMTEIVDEHQAYLPSDDGPQIAVNYRVVDAPSGAYTVGSTYSGTSQRAVIGASFKGTAGAVIYLPALNVNDEDDATFDYVDVTQDEFLRGALDDDFRLARAVHLVGLETSGSKTISIEGATESDFSDAVELDSVTFTATGSYTADTVEFTLPGTTGYTYYRFLLATPEGIRPYTVELYEPADDATAAAHIADTTGAHAASAVGFTPAAGIAATDVQAAIVEDAGDLAAHLADTTAAHAASAVAFTPAGTIAATTVQAAIEEVSGDVAAGGIPATIFDVKGDLIVASAADTAARLAAGTNGHVLTANSAATNGVEWAAAGSGSLVFIAETVLGSAAADITLTGISGAYRDLIVVFKARESGAVDVDFLNMRVGNGSIDTGANYTYARRFDGTSAGLDSSTSASTAVIGTTTGSTSTANSFVNGRIEILNYASTSHRRTWIGQSYQLGTGHYLNIFSGAWKNTSAAIDQIRIYAATGNLEAGSRLAIYGRG